MPNTNLTIDWIGDEALALAHEKATFIGSINREFDDSFKPGRGNAIRIRVPSQYTVTSGRVIDVQDSVEQSTSITVATQHNVAMRFNSAEYAQDLVNFRRQHLEPAMAQLVSFIDGSAISSCTQATYNIVGTAGTAISNLSVPGLARARLNQYLTPPSDRSIQIESVAMGDIVNGVAAYFAPREAIAEQYREGFVARTAMADYYENERVWNMVNGDDITAWISTYTIVDGDVDLTVSAISNTPQTGQTFTIAGVFACHPETKAAYNHLQAFAITSDSTSSDFNITPTIRLTGARKNVCRSTGADLIVSSLTSAAITFTGAVSSTYPQPLMYHRDAFTFATAKLPMMQGKCVIKEYDGIALRVWEDSDIRNDENITRIDILWGIAAIRPQWACRLIGNGT